MFIKRLAIVIVTISAVGALVFASSSTAAAAKEKKIPIVMVGVGNSVGLSDWGGSKYSTVAGIPPVAASVVSAGLNTLCKSGAGEEVILMSDSETLAVGTTKVLSWPKNPPTFEPMASDYDGSDWKAGYGQYDATCITGVVFKKVPIRKFYQIIIDGSQVGTYSLSQLRAQEYSPFFKGENKFCGINSNGITAPSCR